jgi:predicted GNAT family acetyltransferase
MSAASSADQPATPEVVDNHDASRFEIVIDGQVAELVYHVNGRRLVLIHTGVPDELGGHGLGGVLVRAALDRARREELTIVPNCPYARHWLETHADEIGDVEIDWS